MPPILASIGSFAFILYLFYLDFRRPDRSSLALWVPTAWMFLAGSRYVSSWLGLNPEFQSAQDYAEGSPIDRAVFFGLIVMGLLILFRRKLDWQRVLVGNGWIVLYLLYCLASVAWSEEPEMLMKRWVKDLGNPIMALVILSEAKPYEALGVVLRRLAFVMLPLSVLFCKYYPELGRWYRVMGDGAETFIGVGRQKNDLGLICLISGIYLAWDWWYRRKEPYPTFVRQNKISALILGAMLVWLLYACNSQTSLVCLLIGLFILLLGRSRVMLHRPDTIFAVLFLVGMEILLLDQAFGLKEIALNLLGRRPDLTERTEIWRVLLGPLPDAQGRFVNTDPALGVGFQTFWTGERLEEAWRLLRIQIHQAHNGYLEQYLNLGFIGIGFILMILLDGLLKVRRHMMVDHAGAMLRLCYIVVAALSNWTEASFYGLNNLWILLLLACLEVPQQRQLRTANNVRSKYAITSSNARYQQLPSRVQHLR
jgi:exopolysaccharide production protein ExoQ